MQAKLKGQPPTEKNIGIIWENINAHFVAQSSSGAGRTKTILAAVSKTIVQFIEKPPDPQAIYTMTEAGPPVIALSIRGVLIES